MTPRGIGLSLALAVLVADQLSKQVMLGLVFVPPRVIEVTGFFNLVPVWNRGVSFGLFSNDAAHGPYLLAGFAFAVSIALAWWMWRAPGALVPPALGAILGGAIGNAVDRLRFGAVVDFLDLHLQGWHWPAFNVADAAITIGVAALLADGLIGGKKGASREDAP